MSTDQITTAALALPLDERVQLAQALWVSIDKGLVETSEAGAVEEAVRRAEELDRGVVHGKPHEEAMRDLRRSL